MEHEDRLILEGARYKLAMELQQDVLETKMDCEKFIDYLEVNKEVLSEEEQVVVVQKPNRGKGFILPGTNYYIDLKKSTVVIIAKLLQIQLKSDFIDILSLFNGELNLVNLREEFGELCIVKEILQSKKKCGDRDLLSRNNGECCNNDMDCKFKSDGLCRCSEIETEKILQNLTYSGVFREQAETYYYQL